MPLEHAPGVMLLPVLALLVPCAATGQTASPSASQIIKHWKEQPRLQSRNGVIKTGCGSILGEARSERALANSLVKTGSSAVPVIEQALDSFASRSRTSELPWNLGWLLFAYARIQGPDAYPRLHELAGNPKLGPYAIHIDESIALAFSLTSYVSSRRLTGQGSLQCQAANSTVVSSGPAPCKPTERELLPISLHCDRADEPRDALDKLILAWEVDNRPSLEETLGPTATSALAELLKGRTWAAMRSKFWSRVPHGDVEVGYRLAVLGRWSEPEETLEDERTQGNLEGTYINPEIETLFTNRSGRPCGTLRLQFSTAPLTKWPEGPKQYQIDNADLGNLLRLIAACAADTQSR